MAERTERYLGALEAFKQPPHHAWKQLMVAICLVQLGDYRNARHHYGVALQGFLANRSWCGTSQPNRLIDTYVLTNQPSFYSQVSEQVETYKADPRGRSLVALYAYAMIYLLSGEDEEAKRYVSGLLKKPKAKNTLAMGQIIVAIIERDQLALVTAMDNLLKAHRGMAKFGRLRETPEGFLCLPAMSLSKMALERGMEVTAESEYLSRGYLDYLLQQRNSISNT